MPTVKEDLLKLEAHERESTVRMESIDSKFLNIDRRLNETTIVTRNMSLMLWGVYPLIIGLFLIDRLGAGGVS